MHSRTPHQAWFRDTELGGPAACQGSRQPDDCARCNPRCRFSAFAAWQRCRNSSPIRHFPVFDFQLIEQFDEAIRRNYRSFHLLQLAERACFIAGSCTWISQEASGFFVAIVIHQIVFFGSDERVCHFGGQPSQNIHFGEVEALLSGFQIGIDGFSLISTRSSFGAFFTFGTMFNSSAPHNYQLLVFVGFGGFLPWRWSA